MASQAVYDAIRARIEQAWPVANPVVTFENDEFTEPTDANGRALPFVVVEMTGTLYGQQSIGASNQADNRWDEEGTLWLHVFVATGSGTRDARGWAKDLADLFRGVTLLTGTLEFLDASIGLGEKGDDKGNYFRISVSIDWRRWEA